jgi:hypothetical protein
VHSILHLTIIGKKKKKKINKFAFPLDGIWEIRNENPSGNPLSCEF